jgi:hypothetical protein
MGEPPLADDLNPYAPSSVVDPRAEEAAAVVGVWRDGNLIVLHREATLPAICVKTGVPATDWLAQKFSGHDHLFSFQTRRFDVRVPLSARRYWMATRLRSWLLTAGIVILFGIPSLVLNVGDLPERIQVFTIFAGVGLAAPLLIYGGFLSEPVHPRRFRGDHLWLSGADERFLVHLAAWSQETR